MVYTYVCNSMGYVRATNSAFSSTHVCSVTKQAFSVVGSLLPSKCMVSYYKFRNYSLDMYGNVVFSRWYWRASFDGCEQASVSGGEKVPFLLVNGRLHSVRFGVVGAWLGM